MENNASIEEITLAALLHDIGKFFQRAQTEKAHQKHSYLSKKLILSELRNLIEDKLGLNTEEIAKLAGKHHDTLRKNEYNALIVQKADRLSSGLDRISFEKEKLEDNYLLNKKSIYKTIFPIFLEISSQEFIERILDKHSNIGYYFKPLNTTSAFPSETSQYTINERKKDYNFLLKSFLEDIEKIRKTGDFNLKYEALKTIMIKYLWCVPSNTYASSGKISLPDIPLVDHLISTAAIATALKAYHEKNGYRDFENSEAEKFLLLSADFSGIQNFIFQKSKETKKWAAKILRARSFMVSLALESVIREFIKEFEVNVSVVLTNAGGKCLLLLPNYSDSENRIKKIKKDLTQKLLKRFYGEIKIKIAWIKLSESDLELKNFQKKLEELHIKESVERFRLFDIENLSTFVFSDYVKKISQADRTVCPVCGVRPATEEFNKEKVCELCKYLITIGENLPKSKGVVVDFDSKFSPIPMVVRHIRDFEELKELDLSKSQTVYLFDWDNFEGVPVKLVENHIPITEEIKEKWKKELVEKTCYNDENNKFRLGIPKNLCHIGMESLKVEKTPIGERIIYGKPILAVLKADVDRLGFIFIKGFARDTEQNSILSLSRMVSLSRMLDFFFTEIIKKTIREKYNDIYSVFSGGDDLFLIGAWDQVLRFAVDLREEFRKYVCSNPEFTISAGIALVFSDTPVYTIAREGEDALKLAKKKRNTTVVFGKRVYHEKGITLGELLKTADELEEFLKKEKLSTATLYKLFHISEMANNLISEKENCSSESERRNCISEEENRTSEEGSCLTVKIENALWRPYLYYLLFRNWKTDKKKEERRKEIEEKVRKFEKWISDLSENATESKEERKDNLFYIPVAIAIYRRRKYEKTKFSD